MSLRGAARAGRRTVLVGAAALLLSGALACGIPGHTDVQVDGRGPVSDTAPANGTRQPPPGRAASGSDPKKFAKDFLTAAAGEAGETYRRVNDYIVPDRRFEEKPADEVAVNIIRAEEPEVALNSDGTYTVRIEGVQQVGVLRANGMVAEPTASETAYTFTVGPAPTDPGPSGGLYVLDPPPVLLMTTQALREYYEPHTIYFWNTARTALVPDLRYLPLTVPVERQATEVLGWLIGDPAPWLSSAVVPLPDGTGMLGNVPAPKDGGRLEVNLSVRAGALANDGELDQLFQQIVWSMQGVRLLRNELELKIQNQSRRVAPAAEHRRSNPVYPSVTGVPARYCVLAGAVYPLTDGPPNQQVPIAAAANRDIVAAGMTVDRGRIFAALVVADGDKLRLRVGTGAGVVSQFHTSRPYGSIGRPVWLKGAGGTEPIGLVVINNRLHRFSADQPTPVPVQLAGISDPVLSVGAALDGHRIALVAGKNLYVATVRRDGTPAVTSIRRLATSLTNLSAVDWLGETHLAVAGVNTRGRAAIVRITVDGAQETAEAPDIGAPVTHLAAYPNNPIAQVPLRNPLYEANQVAYASGTSIGRDQVVAGSGTLPAGSPTAPFFLF